MEQQIPFQFDFGILTSNDYSSTSGLKSMDFESIFPIVLILLYACVYSFLPTAHTARHKASNTRPMYSTDNFIRNLKITLNRETIFSILCGGILVRGLSLEELSLCL
jgi:hypothetical protein